MQHRITTNERVKFSTMFKIQDREFLDSSGKSNYGKVSSRRP